MEKPLVSIIMPAYNCEKTIARAVTSVQIQSYRNWELIICDDASTDGTMEQIHELAQTDKRITILESRVNQGPALARNRAIDAGQGEYLAFLDADDEWLEGKLASQMDFMKENSLDFCYTGYYLLDREGVTLGERLVPKTISYESLLAENFIILSTVLLKANTMQNTRFNNDYVHEDFVFWLELLKNGLVGGGMQKLLAKYSMGGRSSNKANAAKNRWIVYRKSEGLSLVKAIKYFIQYMKAGMIKYKK